MNYLKNGWNWVHLSGSCNLTLILFKFTEWGSIITFGLGLLWECLDELNKRYEWNLWFLDPNGFDIKDWLIMDLIGILLAYWIIGGSYVKR